MTSEQKIEVFLKAMKKVGKSGLDVTEWFPEELDRVIYVREEIMVGIIFSHPFAKAFWGEDEVETTIVFPAIKMKEWELRLQQMVLEEEPLEYIERFI